MTRLIIVYKIKCLLPTRVLFYRITGVIIDNSLRNWEEIPHDKVTLCVDIHKEQACITVSDTGIGISSNKLKHLYNRFLDGDYRQMRTLGTGIGLSLVKDLVKLHHGKIDCESEEGKGTTFTIYFPIDRGYYQEGEVEDTQFSGKQKEALDTIADFMPRGTNDIPAQIGPKEQATKEYTILFVEDNTELLSLMSHLLATRYQVITANNGEKAQKVIQKSSLDIVVTDVMMPGIDGIELTKWIKKSKDYSQLPVIMLTAKTQNEDRNEGYRIGADDYICKPFNLSDLQLRIDNIIANRERIRLKFQTQTSFKVEDQHYSSPDEVFLQQAIDKIMEHIADSDYGREEFASDLCISSSTLYYKLRAITGQNITSFITSIRMKEACKILRDNPSMRINELCYLVGFSTPRYFSQCFKKEYGMGVKEYVNSILNKQEKQTE